MAGGARIVQSVAKFMDTVFAQDTEIVGGSDMELPTDECLQLKVLLVSSNLSLPPAQRKASGYSVCCPLVHPLEHWLIVNFAPWGYFNAMVWIGNSVCPEEVRHASRNADSACPF